MTYARVSSQEQAKEGFSIPAQDKLLSNYAREKELDVTAAFTDVETAKKAGRTGFDAMVGYLRKNSSCRVLLVEKTDRLYRNFRDWVTIDEIPGLEVHFVKEATVISEESRSSEKFIHGIKVLMAKNFIDNLSEETRKGMIEKASQGIWPSYAPIGYLNADGANGKRTIVPDPALAPLVRRLYELCATGKNSMKELAAMAQSEHLTRGRTVNKILRNRVYSGEFEWRGEKYTAAYEAIIPRDLWMAAQARTGSPPGCACEEDRPLLPVFRDADVRLMWFRNGRGNQEGEIRLLPLLWRAREMWRALCPSGDAGGSLRCHA